MSPKPEEGEDFETKLFFPTTSQNEEISDLKKFPPPEQKDEKEQILSAIGSMFCIYYNLYFINRYLTY